MYDENEAVNAINKALKEKGREPYSSDELLNVIDMIWDYYEENGMLEVDDDDDDMEEDIAADLADYIRRMLKKDKQSKVDSNDVDTIVEAELDYEDDSALDL
ncbi:MAG: hypothetical protein K2H61_01015 [Muribaculaceae bacterium]|nr:hypothetical protein [Muribaculaceae bacterium]MDE7393146.1 hypothetical protein [Muribaculaceae bacterium]